ncbi:MAG TPA: hypothetical protein VFT95_22670 [Micromonosporaceae bacterium]|nr:hypothetical protein [Micromonosporaceae bacterium]
MTDRAVNAAHPRSPTPPAGEVGGRNFMRSLTSPHHQRPGRHAIGPGQKGTDVNNATSAGAVPVRQPVRRHWRQDAVVLAVASAVGLWLGATAPRVSPVAPSAPSAPAVTNAPATQDQTAPPGNPRQRQ